MVLTTVPNPGLSGFRGSLKNMEAF